MAAVFLFSAGAIFGTESLDNLELERKLVTQHRVGFVFRSRWPHEMVHVTLDVYLVCRSEESIGSIVLMEGIENYRPEPAGRDEGVRLVLHRVLGDIYRPSVR